MRNIRLFITILVLSVSTTAYAADFVCMSDVPKKNWTHKEQKNIDLFWNDTLVYLDEYVKALETPTGKCVDSAEAVLATYSSSTGKPETVCIARVRDVELNIKHIKAILAEPDKAKLCFDPQSNNSNGWAVLYTPSRELQKISPVAEWLNRPIAVDYFEKIKDSEIREAGLKVNQNFIEITSKTDSSAHFKRDITIKGLPHLWSSVGWLPFYSENPKAWNKSLRGGYLYAEVMGPWGNLRVDTIDKEIVGAEVGMTVQLSNTSYPVHFHHPQEIYMNLTTPDHPKQNRFMALSYDNDQFKVEPGKDGYKVRVNGDGKWEYWYMNADPVNNWLLYLDRNALHAFYAGDKQNLNYRNTGWVNVWARTTVRDNDQNTRLSTPDDNEVKEIIPSTSVTADTKKWKP